MRGIQFPVGQATLSPDNDTLVAKVQQAIQTFGQPTVTIEGHTDSTGSVETNQELSQERTKAMERTDIPVLSIHKWVPVAKRSLSR